MIAQGRPDLPVLSREETDSILGDLKEWGLVGILYDCFEILEDLSVGQTRSILGVEAVEPVWEEGGGVLGPYRR